MKYKFIKSRELDEELRALYEEKGKLPDMRHLEHKRRHRTTRILIMIVIFLGILTIASWAGFFLFGAQLGGGGEVEVRIDGSTIAVSGLSQQITIHYKNLDRNPLAFAKLRLRAPATLLIQEMDPKPAQSTEPQEGLLEWDFGTLPAKSTGEIHLTLIPFGAQDDQVELQTIFSYKPANFNAEFQTSTAHTFTIQTAGIATQLTGPDQATPGQELDFKAWVRNDTDKTFEKLYIALDLPPTFTMGQTETPFETGISWKIDSLAPGEEHEFVFQGSFLVSAEGEQKITLTADIEQEAKRYRLGQSSLLINVTAGTFNTAELLINGKSGAQQWARLDQSLTITLRLGHRAAAPLDDVSAVMQIRGDILDLTKLASDNGTTQGGTITFPKTGKLVLEPNQSYELSVRLDKVAINPKGLSPITEIQAEIAHQGTLTRTPPVRLIIVSDLNISAEARYFGASGAPIGSGPLPPRVGEETHFMLRFRIQNTFHDLSNIVINAKLPENVRWADKTEAQIGKLSFDNNSREVRWDIPRLTITSPVPTAQFEIAVTPKPEDRGGLALLMGVTRAEALDTISQMTFSSDAPSVSSALEADSFGKGKGVVE